jgi:hypothetical protein
MSFRSAPPTNRRHHGRTRRYARISGETATEFLAGLFNSRHGKGNRHDFFKASGFGGLKDRFEMRQG